MNEKPKIDPIMEITGNNFFPSIQTALESLYEALDPEVFSKEERAAIVKAVRASMWNNRGHLVEKDMLQSLLTSGIEDGDARKFAKILAADK